MSLLMEKTPVVLEAGPDCEPSQPATASQEVVLEPPRSWQVINFRELWHFRDLIYFLAWRDVKIRYKQTFLGAAWAVLQPAMLMVVFAIFFRNLAGSSTGDMPYPLFFYAGLLPWTFFATAISNGGNSVIGSERLITKVYFPALAIPFAAVGAALVDFVVAGGLLVVLMLCYGVWPVWSWLLVPPIVAGADAGGHRHGHAAGRPERGLSRFPLRDSVLRAGVDVRHAEPVHGSVQRQPGSAFGVGPGVRLAEPADRHDRRLPRCRPGRPDPVGPAGRGGG